MLDEWQLSEEMLVTLTTDSASNMVSAARKNGWFRVPCFGHVLHNGVAKAMEIPSVREAKGTCSCLSMESLHYCSLTLKL